MQKRKSPSRLELSRVFKYVPKERGLVRKDGRKCGTVLKSGHIQVRFKGRKYYMHQLVWLWHKRTLPEGVIDHINGDPADNRIRNLRAASVRNNAYNTRKTYGTSRFKGVYWNTEKNKWAAKCSRKFLGYFHSETLAALAYNSRARKVFGRFASLNEVDLEEGI